MNKSFLEKRVFARLEENANLRYKIIKPVPDEKEYLTAIKDISVGGLAFISQKKIPVGTILMVKIELLDSLVPVECLAKVLRMSQVKERTEVFYQIGVLFLDLAMADSARITQYIDAEKNPSSF